MPSRCKEDARGDTSKQPGNATAVLIRALRPPECKQESKVANAISGNYCQVRYCLSTPPHPCTHTRTPRRTRMQPPSAVKRFLLAFPSCTQPRCDEPTTEVIFASPSQGKMSARAPGPEQPEQPEQAEHAEQAEQPLASQSRHSSALRCCCRR